jgi:hypothetical protein
VDLEWARWQMRAWGGKDMGVCLFGKRIEERPKEVMCMVCRHVVGIRNANNREAVK